MPAYVRQSPVRALIEAGTPTRGTVQDMETVRHFGDPDAEKRQRAELALADVSALRRFGVKGAGAAAWLAEQGVSVPEATYDWTRLDDNGGLVIKVKADEFLLEESIGGDRIPALRAGLGAGGNGAYGVERQDAAFLLCGAKAEAAVLQTCAIDFSVEQGHLVLTGVAEVDCAVLARDLDGLYVFRIWTPPSSAVYLFEQLQEISAGLGGTMVGLDAVTGIL